MAHVTLNIASTQLGKYFPLAVKNSATAKKASEINNTTANRPVMYLKFLGVSDEEVWANYHMIFAEFGKPKD